MSLRTSFQKLIRRDPERPSLRERAAATAGRVEAFKATASSPAPSHVEQVAHAGTSHDVLAGAGIDHRDGTVSYCDATGRVSRRPLASWINFSVQQMHSRVQGEIGRRRVIEANHLPGEEHVAWEAQIRRELRADAIFALSFQPERAFKAEQDRRSGAEPTTAEDRAETDAMLLALAPEWEAARDAYAEAIQRQITVSDDAANIEPPPSRDRPHDEWRRLVEGWRERTGVEAVEAASAETLDVLCAIEDRIAELPAASLAGLRLKARVAQRNEDIDVDWPDKLGEGLTRDLLAFTAEPDVDWHNPPPGFMAAPAIEPFGFTQVHNGIAMELGRLRGIAWAEYHRRTANPREGASQEEVQEHRAKVRADLFLPALTAAVDLGSTEAQVLAALSRPAGPDPVLALIEEHRAAYADWDRLSQVWNEMTPGSPAFAEAMAASNVPGQREVAAYDALLTARPDTIAGLLALAEYLQEAVDRARIDVEPSDGERALSVVTNALRVILATREEQVRRETSLVDMLDLASATIDELQAIRDIVEHVSAAAYAYTWGPRCGTRKGRYGAIEPNELGKLMHWLGDALTEIESAAELEVSRRTPSNRADRETRLSMCAVTTIDGGDSVAIEAFARELLAHVEAEREGR